MKMKERNTFSFRGRTKTLYFMTLIALLAVGAIGYLMVPTSGTVSAQSSESVERDVQNLNSFEPVGSNQAATADMISNALSNRTGKLSDMVSSVKQLPCTEVGGDLGGRKFTAGVYCVSSARLAGNMILDGGGDANAIFIFNVKGSLEAMNASNINLVNEAKSYNVFFAADSATIGEESNFRAGILTNKAIEVNSSARVEGKLMSISGEVNAPEAITPNGGGNGNLEICKRVLATPQNTGNLENRVFNFTITGVNIPAPINVSVRAGFCSSDIEVPNGPAVITENNTTTNLTGGDLRTGGFALTGVRALSANPTSGGSSLNLATLNLATRTVGITIANSTSLNQLTVEFTNVFAITGFIEICKRAAFIDGSTTIRDPDVQGTFRFTVAGVFIAGSNTVLQVFNVPVGQCTGAIAVTLPFATPPIATNPREGTVVVTELGEEGSFLVSTSTLPADRAVGVTTFNANGGGSRTVRVLEGGVDLETIVFFFNRSRPGQLKICKIAGPGIPLNTIFTFRVRGLGPIDAAGTIGQVDRMVEVAAGAPNAQGGGGTCNFVPGFGAGVGNAERQTFVIGSIILTDELTPVTINGNAVLVSNITTTSTFAPGSPSLGGRFADVIARRDIVEVTYTNFVFRPSILKVCKIAGANVAIGTPFTFDVTLANPVSGGVNPPFTVPVTVNAGPAGPQGGNCNIVEGGGLLGGAFNQGSTVTITERAAGATTVASIASTTSTLASCIPANTRCTLLTGANGIVAGVTQVTFTNTAPAPAPIASRPFDFDGDGIADVSVFRPENGGWYINQSRDGFRGETFGQAGDKPVPADFDGDGKTDIAVYRPSNGTWYINRTTEGFTGINFGNATDIPQAVDFNGDNKAEIAVFRPSNGYWYVMNLATGEFTATQFGQNGDKPVAADYDGDRRADYAVFRNGGWYILQSRDGFTGVQFGQAGDKPVPADYDNDGKADIGVYRSTNGGWYINRSTAGLLAKGFGASNDMATPADFDGDGKADISVFRPSNGTFFIEQSGTGMKAEQFGQNGDRPTPNSFIQ